MQLRQLNVEPISTTIVINPVEERHHRLSGFSLFKHSPTVIYSFSPAIYRDCLEPAATANIASAKAITSVR